MYTNVYAVRMFVLQLLVWRLENVLYCINVVEEYVKWYIVQMVQTKLYIYSRLLYTTYTYNIAKAEYFKSFPIVCVFIYKYIYRYLRKALWEKYKRNGPHIPLPISFHFIIPRSRVFFSLTNHSNRITCIYRFAVCFIHFALFFGLIKTK